MKNTPARKIVANLAWRFRHARQLANKERDKDYSVQLRARAESHENEAWNAYMSSLQLLYQLEETK